MSGDSEVGDMQSPNPMMSPNDVTDDLQDENLEEQSANDMSAENVENGEDVT